MACSEYKVDVNAPLFGTCVCGHKKQEHNLVPGGATASNKTKETPSRSSSTPVKPPGQADSKPSEKVDHEKTTPIGKTGDGNSQSKKLDEEKKLFEKIHPPVAKKDVTKGISGRYNEMKAKVAECFTLCKELIHRLKIDTNLQEIEVLFEKVSRKSFDAFFPVYGAMKAGKSTVLDCIFESKVLPSRALPMTTIPIKIGHRSSLEEPQLEIPSVENWNQYLRLVATSSKPIDSNHELEMLRQNLHKHKLDQGVIVGPEIARNLFLLSDVVRIGLMNGITLENNNLTLNLGMLPTLLLKVPMFQDIVDEQNFFFIDTPGPDECRMSDSLEKINRVVLNESCGAMCVIPHHSVAASHTYEIMGPAVDCCIRDNKRLVVLINQIDSMAKMDEELPMVIDSIRQGMFNFTNVEIIGISASRLKFARELRKELQKRVEPSDLLRSDAWQNYVKANISMTDKVNEVLEAADYQTSRDLRVFNYNAFKNAIISIYNDAQYLALTSLLSDMHKIVQRLRDFVIQIESCVKGEAEQLKKLKDLEVQLQKINEYRATIEGIKTNLKDLLPKIFKEESSSFEKWALGQNWIIVDRDTNERIEEAPFTNNYSLEAWYRDESDAKMLPKVTNAFESFANKLRERVGQVVSLEWAKMNKLRDSISGAIGTEPILCLSNILSHPYLGFKTLISSLTLRI